MARQARARLRRAAVGGAAGSIGLGFAIPIDTAQRIVDEIISTGSSSTPVIGVSLDTSFPGPGARVSEVTQGSGADEAGLQDGDVITAIDGDVIAESTELIDLRVLQQQGKVRCRHLPSGEALYAPLGRDVHHLTCLECGSSEPLNFCPMEQQGLTLPTPDGFKPLFHTLEVFGYCVNCSSHG